jgi:hypothetical protein
MGAPHQKIRSSFALKQVRYKTALPLPRPVAEPARPPRRADAAAGRRRMAG